MRSLSNHLMAHYCDVIIAAMASQITSLAITYPTVCSGAVQRKLQRSASLAFVRGIHGWPVNSPHKVQLREKCFIMHFTRDTFATNFQNQFRYNLSKTFSQKCQRPMSSTMTIHVNWHTFRKFIPCDSELISANFRCLHFLYVININMTRVAEVWTQ